MENFNLIISNALEVSSAGDQGDFSFLSSIEKMV
jgi:hypothetical protein